VWEARDSAKINYLKDLLSDNYDSVQLIASNPNGLISYFAADSKGKALDYLNPNISVDHHGLHGDYFVRVARSCKTCHVNGIIDIKDEIRNLFKGNFDILAYDDKFKDLFSGDLPIDIDRKKYVESLHKATDMDSVTFTFKFVSVWKEFFRDLTIEQAAMELSMSLQDFKDFCLKSGEPHLFSLLVSNKIPRVHFQEILGDK